MNYLYDGSFYGFLTVVFESYKVLEMIEIKVDFGQNSFIEQNFKVKTEEDKALRVKKSIEEKFGKSFFREIYMAFQYKDDEKDIIISRTIKEVYKNGLKYLSSSDYYAVNFNRIVRNIVREVHRYKGLLRFREVQDKYLVATFSPENNILQFLYQHFVRRMPNEKFIIYDDIRNLCVISLYGKCEVFEVEELELKNTPEEDIFSRAWKTFYKSVSIKERENKKLMQSNMPKKYWKNIIEKNSI